MAAPNRETYGHCKKQHHGKAHHPDEKEYGEKSNALLCDIFQ